MGMLCLSLRQYKYVHRLNLVLEQWEDFYYFPLLEIENIIDINDIFLCE